MDAVSKCEFCKTEFEPKQLNAGSPPQRFCSPKCRRNANTLKYLLKIKGQTHADQSGQP